MPVDALHPIEPSEDLSLIDHIQIDGMSDLDSSRPATGHSDQGSQSQNLQPLSALNLKAIQAQLGITSSRNKNNFDTARTLGHDSSVTSLHSNNTLNTHVTNNSDSYSLITRSLDRHFTSAKQKQIGLDYRRKFKDPQDPIAQQYLRARYPDFDELYLSCLEKVDYKFECKHDARFATKYVLPEKVESMVWGGPGKTGSDITTNNSTLKGHLKGVDRVEWLPIVGGSGSQCGPTNNNFSGKSFVSAGHDGIRLWGSDTANNNNISVLENISGNPTYCLTFSGQDRGLMISGGLGDSSKGISTINLYKASIYSESEDNLNSSRISYNPSNSDNHISLPHCIPDAAIHALDLNGTQLLAGDSLGRTTVIDLNRAGDPNTKSSYLWRWQTHLSYIPDMINNPYEESGAAVTSCRWLNNSPSSSSSNVFITSSKDGKIKLWDTRIDLGSFWNFKSVSHIANYAGTSDSGGGPRPCFELSKPHSGLAVHDIQLLNHNSSGSHSFLSCGSDNQIKTWDLRFTGNTNDSSSNTVTTKFASGSVLNNQIPISETFLGHSAPIRSVSLSPDGKYISSCCEDGSLRIFRMKNLDYQHCKLNNLAAKKRKVIADFTSTNQNQAPDSNTNSSSAMSLDNFDETTSRLTKKYTEKINVLSKHITKLTKKGYTEADRSLVGHNLCCTSASWINSPESRRGERYRIVSSSWDQSVGIWEVDMMEDDF